MTPRGLLTAFGVEAERIAWTAARRDLTAPVPACPGWTTADVIRHLGSVYRRVTGWVQAGAPPADWERRPPSGAGLVTWFRGGFDGLWQELSSREAGDPCATWFPGDQTAAFWWRRMAHETAIHRVDVEASYGQHTTFDRAFATDGVAEVLTIFLGHLLTMRVAGDSPAPPAPVNGAGEIVVVAAGRNVWRVTLTPERALISTDVPWDCDAVVSAEPAIVYQWLWGRADDSLVRIEGDRAAVAKLRAALARAT